MSTLAEIEAAIEALPAPQVERLTVWLNQRQAEQPMKPLSGQNEPPRSIREFFGSFRVAAHRDLDNERIDADLAREAAGGS